MSKRLKEVFANMFHASFLETIEFDRSRNTLEIIIEMRCEDGSPWCKEDIRYVNVWHSQSECTRYEIMIDGQSGMGSLILQECESEEIRVQEVDPNGSALHDQQIQYFVNQEACNQEYATIFNHGGVQHQEVRIVHQELNTTSLTINKRIKNLANKEITPDCNMEFAIRIYQEDGFEKFIKLNADNHFTCCIDHLRKGYYHVEEFEYSHYETKYQFNNQKETTETCFHLEDENNTISVINYERCDTQLTISKFMQEGCSDVFKPSACDTFEIQIVGEGVNKQFNLCAENDFSMTLYGWKAGCYEIFEVNGDQRLEVSYVVNGCEQNSGIIEICDGDYANVWVVSHTLMPGEMQAAALRICGYVRSCEGLPIKPCEDTQFKVLLQGCGTQETFLLNCNNNYSIDIAHLCAGEYEIKEISCGDFSTTYAINNGCEKTNACICINEQVPTCVAIINEERNRGNLRIYKYIRNEFNDLVKPKKDASFHVTLSSYCTKNCFTLNAENDFCMCFNDLRFGSYDIREDDVCEYQVSYMVNTNCEGQHARVLIDDCFENEVKIINSIPKSRTGKLKICKFEESDCKELVKPTRDEEFKVQVYGPCFDETYTLRAANNWCVILEGLLEGEYHIEECDCKNYDVSYMINKECAKEACVYLDECNQEVTIINRRRQSGKLSLTAMVRNCDCELVQPKCNVTFDVLIEGSCFASTVCLDAANDWSVCVEDLPEGKYRIIQKDNLGYKVSYYTHGREDSFGKMQLGCQDEEVMIINEESRCAGVVHVNKFIADAKGQLYVPCPQEEFHFNLEARCFSNSYTLSRRNDFCVFFDDLEEGDYQICEVDQCDNVEYRIDGTSCKEAKFTLSSEDVYIDIINHEVQQGMVKIEKRVKRCNALVKPDNQESFQIILKGKNTHEIYDLNCDNDFTICLENLCYQHYEIKENATNCKVCYEIDQQMQDDGCFLYQGEEMAITIINEEVLSGCIEISKMIENEQQELLRPDRCESFDVVIESECYKRKVTLCKDNDFNVRLYDITPGHYEIWECSDPTYVSYVVNDLPYKSACIDVCEEDVSITIINHYCPKGSLRFIASVDDEGCRRAPNDDERFSFSICGENMQEEVCLSCNNNFEETLCDLTPATYTIRDTGCYHVYFEIDDNCYDDMVNIELNGEDVCINVIIQTTCGSDLIIQKCMIDESNHLHAPDKKDEYEIEIIHDRQKQCVTLNANNHFKRVLKQQPMGHYEIKENGCNQVLYQIDDCNPTKNNHFNLGKKAMQVRILNPLQTTFQLHLEACVRDCEGCINKPVESQKFYMCVEGCNTNKTYEMNAANNWQEDICLPVGEYFVSQRFHEDFDDICYLVDEMEVAQVVIDNACDDVFVSSINIMKCYQGSLEISKLIQDDRGCYRYPSKNEAFWIIIKGEQEVKRVLLNDQNRFHACLKNLVDGWYEVVEENGNDQVKYVVNNANASKKGILQVCGNSNTINIINPPTQSNMGSLHLQKIFQNGSGDMMRVQNGEYRIHVSKPGFNEVYTLNKDNQYMMTINNLAEGMYVVEELDHDDVMYIVNGGSASNQAIVHIMNNQNNVQVINTIVEQYGSIQLDKYIRNDKNEYVKPPENFVARVKVSAPNYSEIFTLDYANQFSFNINNLAANTYTIEELDAQLGEVSYIIDNGSEVRVAAVKVDEDMHEVFIINSANGSKAGSIRIEKFVRSDQDLIRPNADFVAQVSVSKAGFNEVYELNQANGWSIQVNDLTNGQYLISEMNAQNDVSYMVNGGNETKRAIVDVMNNINEVIMINAISSTLPEGGSLSISKMVRNAINEIIKPNGGVYQVQVISTNYLNTITLDQSNNYEMTLFDLPKGTYTIREANSNTAEVTYIVDGAPEASMGSVIIDQSAHSVQVINTIVITNGVFEIRKMIKNADGTFIRPADGDEFTLEIYNDQTTRQLILNSGNFFTMRINDLANGRYRIRELNNENYLTSYRVNEGPETLEPIIFMGPNIVNSVVTYNELKEDMNTIEVFKYLLDNSGNYLPPLAPNVYSFEISGNGIQQIYELNMENSWHVTIRTLPSGVYEIRELGSPYPIQYLVNSAQLQDRAEFSASPGMTSVIGIINMIANENVGNITITKRMQNSDGTLSTPNREESFEVLIKSDNYEQIVTLSAPNNFTQTLNGLSFGMYEVIEQESNYQVSYRVNEGEISEQASVNIDATATNVVVVINAPLPTRSTMGNTLRVVIE